MMVDKRAAIVFLAILLLAACKSEESVGCPVPPQGFSKSDLVGTWDGFIETVRDSTIIIREDGLYKQSVSIKRTGFKYESDWLPWRLEYSQQGIPYLHLEGMMLCGAYYYMVECTGETAKTGGGTNWYDACQQKWDYIHDEGVFNIVFGVNRLPLGIELVPFTKSSDGVTGPWYELR